MKNPSSTSPLLTPIFSFTQPKRGQLTMVQRHQNVILASSWLITSCYYIVDYLVRCRKRHIDDQPRLSVVIFFIRNNPRRAPLPVAINSATSRLSSINVKQKSENYSMWVD
jgi:hypothetical protein